MKYLRIFISLCLIVMVSGGTLAIAANPIKLLNRDDSNLAWFMGNQACAAEPALDNPIEVVIDNSQPSSTVEDEVALQMINESVSRQFQVSLLIRDIENKSTHFVKAVRQNKCQVNRITKLNSAQKDMVADTFNYQSQGLTDFVEVIAACRKYVSEYGKCILVANPQSFVTDKQLDADKYHYFLEIIKALAGNG